MKTRILTAAVLVPLLFIVALVLPKMVAAVIFSVLMAIAAYELLYRTGLVRHTRLVLYSCAMAFAVSMWSYADAIHAYLVLLILAFTFLLFAEMMLDHVKVRMEKLGLCFYAGLVVPFLLSSLVRILTMYIGRYVIMIPFVVAFLNDSGAYFVGLKFGKHKLAPVVSPNKTIEGALGGVATAMVGMLIYALIIDLIAPQLTVRYGIALLYGLAGAAVGIFGDLCFSVVKRQTGIKDYGNLFPGHGGVLDRCDSLMAVAPLMEAFLLLMPMVV
ncbi:MAG: phosphatidate cytidylyltransferase [Oscillospiraceae bacterium]|nr:phosphatidate cytidylyltransferase [Oscillospiraceae bacterium]